MTIEQISLFENPLQALIREHTRNDEWVNATKWCEHFGKDWYEFSRSKDTQRYLKALQDKVSTQSDKFPVVNSKKTTGKSPVVKTINRGRAGSQTWVHPLVAIKLAEWLSPEFDIFVKETFKRYLDGDITLADDIVQRSQSTEDLQWLKKRLDGKVARKGFTDELKKHGVTGVGYAMNTKPFMNLYSVKQLKNYALSEKLRLVN